ncbi:hypothetical protein SK3146_04036 [Paenibacillus konkukensis]|uniref:Uncharacterized protein n=2 Tax=Paenibacillus TaxID=44249 RepID=A0ABY4RQJ0_9BACL|nr:hypothetical protein SK3146_04036 [Paenibacillus konkukensis]
MERGLRMQYNLTTKHDLKEIIQSAVEQEKWQAAIKLIQTVLEMERRGRETILIEIKQAPTVSD